MGMLDRLARTILARRQVKGGIANLLVPVVFELFMEKSVDEREMPRRLVNNNFNSVSSLKARSTAPNTSTAYSTPLFLPYGGGSWGMIS